MRTIPVSGAVLSEEDIAAIIETAQKGWITEGEKVKEFGNALKKYIGVRYAVLCNSGSSANLLALTAVKDVYPRKKYIATCATAFPTTIAPIIQNGFLPLFIDADPATLNVRLDNLLRVIEREDVAGVMLAHTLGFPYDAKLIREVCDDLGKFFVEDCADALGTEIYGQKVGSYGHVSTFSFFPAHHITTGEGGAVLTDKTKIFQLLRSYNNWGRDCWCVPGKDNTCGKRFEQDNKLLPEGWDHKYTFSNVGYNLKMTELQAALGLSQFGIIDGVRSARISNYAKVLNFLWKYRSFLELPWPVLESLEGDVVSPFGLPITVFPERVNRDKLVRFLEDNGVRTRPIFAGNITKHPMMYDIPYDQVGELEGSDYIMNHSFWIGCHPQLTKEDLDYVIETFRKFFREEALL